jgi:hypothetical protein
MAAYDVESILPSEYVTAFEAFLLRHHRRDLDDILLEFDVTQHYAVAVKCLPPLPPPSHTPRARAAA